MLGTPFLSSLIPTVQLSRASTQRGSTTSNSWRTSHGPSRTESSHTNQRKLPFSTLYQKLVDLYNTAHLRWLLVDTRVRSRCSAQQQAILARVHSAYRPPLPPTYRLAPLPRTDSGIGGVASPSGHLFAPTNDRRTGQGLELGFVIAAAPPVPHSFASTPARDETAKVASMMEQYLANPDSPVSSQAGSRQSDNGAKNAAGGSNKTKTLCLSGQASRAKGE